MGEEWPLGEKLASVAADLLSHRRFEAFLSQLFAVSPGTWQTVASCCCGLAELPEHAAELFADHCPDFVVTHLPWPLPECEGWAMVLFARPGEWWSTTAAYNRALLEQRARTNGLHYSGGFRS